MALTMEQFEKREMLIKYYKRIVCKRIGINEFASIEKDKDGFFMVDKNTQYRILPYKPFLKKSHRITTALTPLIKHVLKGASVIDLFDIRFVNKEFYETIRGEECHVSRLIYPRDINLLYKYCNYEKLCINDVCILYDLLHM